MEFQAIPRVFLTKDPLKTQVEVHWGIDLGPQPPHTRQKYKTTVWPETVDFPCFSASLAIFCQALKIFFFALYVPGSPKCRFVLFLKGQFRDKCIRALF